MSKQSPDPTDRHIGARVRSRRMMIGMSQEKLGHALNITFQQIQKYEKGTNRIGSGRLAKIAQILDVPITFFYDGMSNAPAKRGTDLTGNPDIVGEFFSLPGAAELAKLYIRLPSAHAREAIVRVAKVIVGEVKE